MTENPSRTVNILWHDHFGDTGNSTLAFVGTSSSTGGKYSAAWYWFNPTLLFGFLSLNATAGVRSMSFVVDGTLEDQGGVGFALQDGFMLSQTSCSMGAMGRVDVAVRVPFPFLHMMWISHGISRFGRAQKSHASTSRGYPPTPSSESSSPRSTSRAPRSLSLPPRARRTACGA